ncbi:OmpA family protein [Cytophagaceae bacterium ABcell3]|nr:OmpA family protein [Cytophagaceae bacterium ABcell3]
MERLEALGWLILGMVSWLSIGCSNSNLSNYQEYHKPSSDSALSVIDSFHITSNLTSGPHLSKKDSVAKEVSEIRSTLKEGQVEQVGESIKVSFDSGIFFDVDSDNLTAEAKENISALCRIMSNYDNSNLLIEGHTDFTGPVDYNQNLSERRAKSVASSIAACGIDRDHIKIKGHGELKPVADNHTPDGRQRNRRVEIIIMGDTAENSLYRTDEIVVSSNDSLCFYPPSSSSDLARQLCDSWQGKLTDEIYPNATGVFDNPVVTNLESDEYSYKVYEGSGNEPNVSEIKLKGTIYDSKTKEPISATLVLKVLPGGALFNNIDSDSGSYSVMLPSGGHYGFMAKAEGYIPKHDNLYVPEGHKYTEVVQDMYLTPVEVGQAINLNNVFFKQSRAELLPSSYPELDEVVEMLQANPKMAIQLNGHTDNQGNPYLNQQLSEDRVEAIKDYFVAKGISPHRIQLEAYGGSRPIASNEHEETRKLNRRVEIVILRH